MKVKYVAYFFTLLILFVKPGPSESIKLFSNLKRYFAGTKLGNWAFQKFVQSDLNNPFWEKKYGDMSKIYIKIFKRRKSSWYQKFNLKRDGEKIVEVLKENGFDPDLETKIITHGYIDDGIIFHNSFAEAYENRGKNNKKFERKNGVMSEIVSLMKNKCLHSCDSACSRAVCGVQQRQFMNLMV